MAAELILPVPPGGRGAAFRGFVPPEGSGAPALAKPPGMIASLSLWRDLSAVWESRADLFPPEAVQGLAQLDTFAGQFFGGRDFGTGVLGALTSDWRLVVAMQDYAAMSPVPDVKLPAFALVVDVRPDDDDFAARLKVAFQSFVGLANLGAAQSKAPPLELGSETFEGVTISTTHFMAPAKKASDEAADAKEPVHSRHNFSPSAAQVGEHFILSSSLGLTRDLVKSLKSPGKPDDATLAVEAEGAALAGLVDAEPQPPRDAEHAREGPRQGPGRGRGRHARLPLALPGSRPPLDPGSRGRHPGGAGVLAREVTAGGHGPPRLRTPIRPEAASMTPPAVTIDPSWAWAPYVPDPGAPWDLARVAHLHRRAGFAAPWAVLQRDLRDGPEASVDRLLDGEATGADGKPAADFEALADEMARQLAPSASLTRLQGIWLYRMISTGHPLRERMTLFWHDHFATSQAKVNNAGLMQRQNDLFRAHALGDFKGLLAAVGKDPAMLIWLDSTANRKAHPNENYAREVMELFTLGRGRYTEKDVQEAARAFTGWFVVRDRFQRGPRAARRRDEDRSSARPGRSTATTSRASSWSSRPAPSSSAASSSAISSARSTRPSPA